MTERSVKLTDKTKVVFSSFLKDDEIHINIRKFYMDKEGEWKPTAQGLTLPFAKGKKSYKALKETILNAESEAEDLPEHENTKKKKKSD